MTVRSLTEADAAAVAVQRMVREGNPVAGFSEHLGYAAPPTAVLGRWLDPDAGEGSAVDA